MRSADFFNFPHFITYKECHSNTEPDLCVSILKKGRTLRVGKKKNLQEFAGNSSNLQCLIIKSTSSSKQRKSYKINALFYACN